MNDRRANEETIRGFDLPLAIINTHSFSLLIPLKNWLSGLLHKERPINLNRRFFVSGNNTTFTSSQDDARRLILLSSATRGNQDLRGQDESHSNRNGSVSAFRSYGKMQCKMHQLWQENLVRHASCLAR
jgi:hypothetical protein